MPRIGARIQISRLEFVEDKAIFEKKRLELRAKLMKKIDEKLDSVLVYNTVDAVDFRDITLTAEIYLGRMD